MNNRIRWQVFLKVSSREKADRLLKEVARAIGREITLLECEPYWKDKSLFGATFSSSIDSEECAPAVLEALQTCGRLARSWTVGPPQFYEGGRWEFSGGATSPGIKLAGVTHIDFQVGNVENTEPKSPSVHQESDSPVPIAP